MSINNSPPVGVKKTLNLLRTTESYFPLCTHFPKCARGEFAGIASGILIFSRLSRGIPSPCHLLFFFFLFLKIKRRNTEEKYKNRYICNDDASAWQKLYQNMYTQSTEKRKRVEWKKQRGLNKMCRLRAKRPEKVESVMCTYVSCQS